jgi:hypothetical protein
MKTLFTPKHYDSLSDLMRDAIHTSARPGRESIDPVTGEGTPVFGYHDGVMYPAVETWDEISGEWWWVAGIPS